MRILFSTTTAVALAAAVLLAACGGSDEGIIVDEHEPSASGADATVTVTASSDPALNGVYNTSGLLLNNVTKVNPIGGDPETCRFRFAGLKQVGSDRTMDGDIRYIPGTNEVRTTIISIDTVEFRLLGPAGAVVDRANDRVNYTGAVMSSTQNSTGTLTLTGGIPMRGDRPEGC